MKVLKFSAVLLVALLLTPTAHAQQSDNRNPGVIQLLNQMDAINADLNRLRGQIEELNNGAASAQKRQKDMYLDLDSRLRRLEQDAAPDVQAKREARLVDLDARLRKIEQSSADNGTSAQLNDLDARIRKLEQGGASGAALEAPSSGVVSATSPSIATTVQAPVPPTAPTPPSVPGAGRPAGTAVNPNVVRKAYDVAMGNYKLGDYQGAIASFESFIKSYPTDALAGNAQYWIGDSFFNLHDFRAAASAQQALIKSYPNSGKVPDAMLILGSAYAAMNDGAAARRTLEDLIARHPSSEAAEKAKQRLARMK